jgi:GxxExxY protein
MSMRPCAAAMPMTTPELLVDLHAADRELTGRILGAAIAVHRELGPGLLEHAYTACFAHELAARGHAVVQQQPLAIEYQGLRIDGAFCPDFLVDGAIVVELKAVDRLLPVHEAQLLTYLRLSRLPVGLLINFHAPLLKHGIRRMRV